MPGKRSLRDDVETVLIAPEELTAAVDSIALRLTEDVGDLNPLFIGVQIGAFVFLADLIRILDFPLEVEFIGASSYRDKTVPGKLEINNDVASDIAGRHLVVVDDIIDTGHTLQALIQMLRKRNAASVRSCCLLDKPERRECDYEADYVGIQIPDRFVVGYGLDHAEQYRNLPYVGVLRPELYNST